MEQDEFLTYDEAAAMIKVHRSTIIRWTREGRLPLFKASRTARVRKSDVLNLFTIWQPSWGGARPGAGRSSKAIDGSD